VAALLAVILQLLALYFPFASSDLPRRILTIGGQHIVRVFSVRDIFVAAGLLVTVAELMSPRISLRAPNS
jgi:hypothetical protein